MKRSNLIYKLFQINLLVISTVLISGCKNNDSNVVIDLNDTLFFIGTFKTFDPNNLNESVSLLITNGRYTCITSLPFGHGAGKVEIDNSVINFVDTAFFVVPAIYGPSYVLSGEYYYLYDSRNLKIWKNKNVGYIIYDLSKQ
jgi:hypothetical protein